LKQNCERGPSHRQNHARSPTSHQVWASVAYAGHLPGWTGYITGFKTEVNAVGQFKDLLSTTADLKRQERCVGIISSPVSPKTSNNIIQKGLAFIRERSGSVTIPGISSTSRFWAAPPRGNGCLITELSRFSDSVHDLRYPIIRLITRLSESPTTFRAPVRPFTTAHLSMNAATGGTCLSTAGGLRYPNPP